MNKKYLIPACLLVFGMLLSGCGFTGVVDSTEFQNYSGADDKTPVNEDLIVVGVSQVGSESVWRTANSNSIQESFTTENGYFLIFDNARQKQENQIKAIREFISQQVDYILISPITEDGWDTVLQEAKDAGIPVILFDRKMNVDESLYTTWVGSDFKLEGTKAGEWLENSLQKSGRDEEEINIVVLKGTEGSSAEVGRTRGFHEIANAHSNWNILEEIDAEYTTTRGKEIMRRMLARYHEIDVVVAQNDDMMFGAVEALNEAGYSTGENGDVLVISFDACRTALQMIETGTLCVDIECNPLQGPYLEQIISMLEKGEEVDRETYIEEAVFDKTNTADYLDERTY